MSKYMKKKKMRYAKVSDFKSPYQVLYSGTCKGYKVLIVNMHGIHPCAYIQIPFDEIDNSDVVERISDNLDCHGGVTYVGDIAEVYPGFTDATHPKHTWVGWDYGHLSDYKPKPKLPKTMKLSKLMIKNPFADELIPALKELELELSHRHQWTTEEVYRDVIRACKSLNDIMSKLKKAGFID